MLKRRSDSYSDKETLLFGGPKFSIIAQIPCDLQVVIFFFT